MNEKLTREKAIEIMQSRGYSHVSTMPKNEVYCFSKMTNLGVCLHATVFLQSEDITLEMVQLKLSFSLNSNKFSFFHKDFEKWEQQLLVYTSICLHADGHFQPAPEVQTVEEKPKKTKADIEERKKKFWKEHVMPIARQKGYTKEFAEEFYNYWTEHKPGARTFRYENENYFDVAKRMATFIKNNNKWFGKKLYAEKKAEEQNAKLKEETKTQKKSDLF